MYQNCVAIVLSALDRIPDPRLLKVWAGEPNICELVTGQDRVAEVGIRQIFDPAKPTGD